MYEIIQIMPTLYFLIREISLVSLDLIAITVSRIDNYGDRFPKLILLDFEGRKLVQLV